MVDDGSTDGTEEALQAFGPRLRYLWQENRGVSAARNAGLRLARGEIVAFLDSDDTWLPDHLETVVAMLEREPEAVLASTCPRYQIRGRDEVAATCLVDPLPIIFVNNRIGYPSCSAARRDALLDVGGFDETLEVGEDSDLFVRLALRGPFALLQRRTTWHQFTHGSLKERGGRRGAYLIAWKTGAASVAGAANGRPELAVRAAGTAHFVDALEAIYAGDDAAARQALRSACAAWPELLSSPSLILGRLGNLAWDSSERLRVFATAASALPQPTSDAALFLRSTAILIAVRTGRLRVAARLLAGGLSRVSPDSRAAPRRSGGNAHDGIWTSG